MLLLSAPCWLVWETLLLRLLWQLALLLLPVARWPWGAWLQQAVCGESLWWA